MLITNIPPVIPDCGPRQSVQDEPGGGRGAAAAHLRAPEAARTPGSGPSAGGGRETGESSLQNAHLGLSMVQAALICSSFAGFKLVSGAGGAHVFDLVI